MEYTECDDIPCPAIRGAYLHTIAMLNRYTEARVAGHIEGESPFNVKRYNEWFSVELNKLMTTYALPDFLVRARRPRPSVLPPVTNMDGPVGKLQSKCGVTVRLDEIVSGYFLGQAWLDSDPSVERRIHQRFRPKGLSVWLAGRTVWFRMGDFR